MVIMAVMIVIIDIAVMIVIVAMAVVVFSTKNVNSSTYIISHQNTEIILNYRSSSMERFS